MATLYDTDFNRNYTTYRNKQRLAGQPVNPNVIGSLAEADLSARYANQDKKRALGLQEQQITNNQTNADRNYNLSLQRLAMDEDAQKAQEKQGLYSAIGNVLPAAMATYGAGKEMGWWGKDKKTTTPTLFDYTGGGSGGGTYDTMGNDISAFDWTYGDEVPANTGGGSSNSSSGIFDWLGDLFKGWF